MGMTRGKLTAEVLTEEVEVGDILCFWLSDASAYCKVTGWTDEVLELSRYGLKDVTRRTFEITGSTWWIDRLDRSGTIGVKTFILSRDCDHSGTQSELVLSDCRKGCKRVRCDRCDRERVEHRSTYGCDAPEASWE